MAFVSESRPGSDNHHSRASDADREAVAERLREAATDGRLELAELEDRVEAVYQAKTTSDLESITVDLPGLVPDDQPLRLEATSGSREKSGRWLVPSQIFASCTSGRITFDFTEADCRHQNVTASVSAKSGSIIFVVPVGWGVNMDDVSVASGSVRNKAAELPAPGMPTIIVHGQTKSGSVKARYPRRSFWDWLLRRPRT
jgi:hypothetical protein